MRQYPIRAMFTDFTHRIILVEAVCVMEAVKIARNMLTEEERRKFAGFRV